jgi:hypothetical protein
MKLSIGWVTSAALVLGAAAAHAQGFPPLPRYDEGSRFIVSDIEGPYAGRQREYVLPRYGTPGLLPPQEVFAVVRDYGFSPLGVPQLRGLVYTIAVIDRNGEDGRLVIDARNGRIIRFMPAFRMGDNLNDALTTTYGAVGLRQANPSTPKPRPQPPVSHMTSRTPSLAPRPTQTQSGQSEPTQRSAAIQPKAAPVQAPPHSGTAGQAAGTSPQILPTQEMPKPQGLD